MLKVLLVTQVRADQVVLKELKAPQALMAVQVQVARVVLLVVQGQVALQVLMGLPVLLVAITFY